MYNDFAHSSHTSPNDTFGLDHSNLVMAMNSSAMSPNGNTNAQSVAGANKSILQQSADDNRRKPRPIGIERASWKHSGHIGMNSNLESVDNMGQHSLPPWLGKG